MSVHLVKQSFLPNFLEWLKNKDFHLQLGFSVLVGKDVETLF